MCPCKNCPCIAICRSKYFVDLKNDCSLIEQYLFEGMTYTRRKPDFNDLIDITYKTMKPLYWYVKYTTRTATPKRVQTFSYKRRAARTTKHFFYSGPGGDFQ